MALSVILFDCGQETLTFKFKRSALYTQVSHECPLLFMPPFEKGGAYCVAHVGRYVGRSVCRYPLTLCN